MRKPVGLWKGERWTDGSSNGRKLGITPFRKATVNARSPIKKREREREPKNPLQDLQWHLEKKFQGDKRAERLRWTSH